MSKGKTSKSGKGTYAAYRSGGHYAKNKLKKMERHLKKYPNDKIAEKCLETGLKTGFAYKRKTPNTPTWSHTDKHHAEVWASLGHNGNKYLDYLKKLKVGKVPAAVVKTKEVNV